MDCNCCNRDKNMFLAPATILLVKNLRKTTPKKSQNRSRSHFGTLLGGTLLRFECIICDILVKKRFESALWNAFVERFCCFCGGRGGEVKVW